ncbi:ImmA/IrrE family metallo-endopeptidase [Peribacillus acanthi]|uniref:ImmA/IrrE family metallo-endopeptidase n=1 Tax=Peribacillus acanthi TaxID=2171554 RepID=UPI0013001708|nr:ImmA/IrrE family metallo-endopeptidase [Peribacillus acanthi]
MLPGPLLIKKSNTIILNENITHTARVKFTVAFLIGHLVLPWHTKDSYFYRKAGKSTILTDDNEEMEAGAFAASLITPPELLGKDLSTLSSDKISLKDLKTLADEKYKVSLTSLCHRLIEYDKSRFALINSSNYKIDKVFSGNMLVKEKGLPLDENSKAYELLSHPSKEEELKEGTVNANVWINEAIKNELLYESSIYNPTYNAVMTLLTKMKN